MIFIQVYFPLNTIPNITLIDAMRKRMSMYTRYYSYQQQYPN